MGNIWNQSLDVNVKVIPNHGVCKTAKKKVNFVFFVADAILCRIQLSNIHHSQINAALEQSPHSKSEKFSNTIFNIVEPPLTATSQQPDKINVKFHKNCEKTGEVLKISCARCHFVKFDIYFLGFP